MIAKAQVKQIEEKEVLRLLAAGYSNKEIAAQLKTDVETIAKLKATAMTRLGLKMRIDIIHYVQEQGWAKQAWN
jgi:DNA-binding NarL/FixJ family response regulator